MSVAVASVAGAFSLLQGVQAQSPIPVFTYGDRDLFLCFREDLADPPQTYDVEVDIGPASTYYGAAIGSVIQVNNSGTYTTALLNSIYSSLDTLSWSVEGCVPNGGDSGDATYTPDTLWLTSPRPDPRDVGTVWNATSRNAQAGAAGEIASLQFNAALYSSITPASPDNTVSSLVVPDGGFSCDSFLGKSVYILPSGPYYAYANFDGRFQGNVENTTLPDFTSNPVSQPSRSDLYQLIPVTSGPAVPGTYLGFFELETDGSMQFHRLAAPAPALNITVSGNTSTISFPTGLGGHYTLYYTNSEGLLSPVSSWTQGNSLVGNGGVMSFQVTSTDDNRFYVVQDH